MRLDELLQVWDFYQLGVVATYYTALEELELGWGRAALLFWGCGRRVVLVQP